MYIDDIIIATSTEEEQLMKLLLENGFYINLLKANLFRRQLLYLGHIIANNRLYPDPAKISALQQAQAPTCKKSLLSFYTAANFLRAYILRFSELIKPLTDLTGKYIRFQWTEVEQESFEDIKQAIINACYLTIPKWDKPFIIFADTSEVAVAAVLA